MKKYKFITIRQCPNKIIMPRYEILNNKSQNVLGNIYWYPAWRWYVFESKPECVFNNSCLRDILDFMESHAGKEKQTS